jgi:PKD repeat protein
MALLVSMKSILAAAAVGLGLLGVPSSASAQSAPLAPSALAVSFSSSGVVVTWTDNSADETGFSIERCLGSGCTAFGQIASAGAAATSYTDLFKASNTSQYRVRAFNSAGFSAYSNTAQLVLVSTGDASAGMTAVPTSGQAPLSVTFDGSTSSTLNGTITSWDWSFGDNQTASGVTVAHTYTAPGVYAASLRITTAGFGVATSTTAMIITVTAPPSVAPSDLSATSPVRGQIRLAWTNPASSATSLTLQRCKGATCRSFRQIAVLTTSTTSFVDSSVSRGTTYRYRLAATSSAATTYSNISQATARR